MFYNADDKTIIFSNESSNPSIFSFDLNNKKLQFKSEINLVDNLSHIYATDSDTYIGFLRNGKLTGLDPNFTSLSISEKRVHRFTPQQPTVAVRNHSIAYPTGRFSFDYIQDFNDCDIEGNYVVEFKDLPLKDRILDIKIISTHHILVVGKYGELLVYGVDTGLEFALELKLPSYLLMKAAEISVDGQWLFIVFFNMKEMKPELKVLSISMNGEVKETSHFYFPLDFQKTLFSGFNDLIVLSLKDRPLVVLNQIEGEKRIMCLTIDENGVARFLDKHIINGEYMRSFHLLGFEEPDTGFSKVLVVGEGNKCTLVTYSIL